MFPPWALFTWLSTFQYYEFELRSRHFRPEAPRPRTAPVTTRYARDNIRNRQPWRDQSFPGNAAVHDVVITVFEHHMSWKYLVSYRQAGPRPINQSLWGTGVRGTLVAMRLSSVDSVTVINMRTGDTRRADIAVRRYVDPSLPLHIMTWK